MAHVVFASSRVGRGTAKSASADKTLRLQAKNPKELVS